MENAADSLTMAGAVLIFVLAVSIIIFAFGQARKTADVLLEYQDRETSYHYYKPTEDGTRTVGMETIIPTIFRVYLENYRIVFKNLEKPLFYIQKADGTWIPKYSLDLETNQDLALNPNDENPNIADIGVYRNPTLSNDLQKKEFLRAVLYRDFIQNKAAFEKKFSYISFDGTEGSCPSLYDQLNDLLHRSNTFIQEDLGVYYKTDEEDVPNVNKTEKRIITYTIKTK